MSYAPNERPGLEGMTILQLRPTHSSSQRMPSVRPFKTNRQYMRHLFKRRAAGV